MSRFEMKIPLQRDLFALVDECDFDVLNKHHWWANTQGRTQYAMGWINKKRVYMHRLIFPDSETVDHINGNGLDNRRINLRPCSFVQNTKNRRLYKNSSSGFKGVHWHKRIGRWAAQIRSECKNYHIGCVDTPELAAMAYDSFAIKLNGNFARTNAQIQGIKEGIKVGNKVPF